MAKDNSNLIVIMLLAVAGGIAYWFFFRKPTTAEAFTDDGLNDQDKAVAAAMIAKFQSDVDPDSLQWLLPIAEKVYNGEIPTENKIGGKPSKAGSFLAAW